MVCVRLKENSLRVHVRTRAHLEGRRALVAKFMLRFVSEFAAWILWYIGCHRQYGGGTLRSYEDAEFLVNYFIMQNFIYGSC
jgi:hypothetical protein